MNILDKYISRQVIMTILVVALALLGLDLFFTLINELKLVGQANYRVATLFSYLALTAPTRLYVMFPWAALIGALVSLGALASHSELVVMRTASVSVGRIAWSVIKGTLILTLIVVLFGEGIAPNTEKMAQNKRTLALSAGHSIQTAFGLWVRQGQDFIHVKSIGVKRELLGVTRYHFADDGTLKEVLFADVAEPQGKEQWLLKNIRGTAFLKNKTEVIQKTEMTLPFLLEPELLETATVKHPERLSLPALWRTIQHRSNNDLNADAYELAFWSKVMQPLVILLMVFLAVPFVFGPLRSVSMGFRVIIGIFVAFIFHTINGLFAPLALVYQLPPLLAVILPIIAFGLFGLWMLRRVK
jgi:lipopolysaccharide export system permease protein